MIPKAVLALFSSEIRRRGAEYWASGRVTLPRKASESMAIVVSGSHDYDVQCDVEGSALRASCTCPYFASTGACKHLHAALLALSDAGWLAEGGRGRGSQAIRSLELDVDLGDDFDEEFDEEGDDEEERARAPRVVARSKPAVPAAEIGWRLELAERTRVVAKLPAWGRRSLPEGARLAFGLVVGASLKRKLAVLSVKVCRPRKDGKLGRPASFRLSRETARALPLEDRIALGTLVGAMPDRGWVYEGTEIETTWQVRSEAHVALVESLARAGRVHLDHGASSTGDPVPWADGEWEVRVQMQRRRQQHDVRCVVTNGAERLAADELVHVFDPFIVLPGPRLAALRDAAGCRWLQRERESGPMRVPRAEVDEATTSLMRARGVPPFDAAPAAGFTQATPVPRPGFDMRKAGPHELHGRLTFDYDGVPIHRDEPLPRIPDAATRRVIVRDMREEESAERRLVGLRRVRDGQPDSGSWIVPAGHLVRIARSLIENGWLVTVEGRRFRVSVSPTMRVVTGIDWLELRGEVAFDELVVPLPSILRAAQLGQSTVTLDDGSLGLLPETWLRRNGRWLSLGEASGDVVRFRPTQASLLDALLAELPQATCDEAFQRIRERLDGFRAPRPATQPSGFRGTLRDYQLEGLAWLEFLREFGLGGCLADDMGVGKTAQVLAMLEARRAAWGDEPRRPSLVVVPRSLIFNWLEEAKRFTPDLRVADLSGAERDLATLRHVDVGLITYGTLRRDAAALRETPLDYAILDEAQAIKNGKTAAAKAARLLDARHRLVMTGTPVENHLGELWSLFEFLNPGMLGTASVFGAGGRAAQEIDDPAKGVLRRALRPFLLRRTKEQVAKELPARTEQTIHCEMDDAQRGHYETVREHYRLKLLGGGGGPAPMEILTALLRLRQIACHPGIVDRGRATRGSAKLTTLLERLTQVVAEGHKALVFSQFTSFLAIVRRELDALGMAFEYLDGKTTDRASAVARFQSEAGPPVFLISLKAGGVGLNLTAADYVFLLDPWWNPAVEAQAIDRTHRIGQTRRVFAYRLITAGTIEEKVLQLQERKRALAEAILGAEGSPLSNLTREDLELLLS